MAAAASGPGGRGGGHIRTFILLPTETVSRLASQYPNPTRLHTDDARGMLEDALSSRHLPPSIQKDRISEALMDFQFQKSRLEEPVRLGITTEGDGDDDDDGGGADDLLADQILRRRLRWPQSRSQFQPRRQLFSGQMSAIPGPSASAIPGPSASSPFLGNATDTPRRPPAAIGESSGSSDSFATLADDRQSPKSLVDSIRKSFSEISKKLADDRDKSREVIRRLDEIRELRASNASIPPPSPGDGFAEAASLSYQQEYPPLPSRDDYRPAVVARREGGGDDEEEEEEEEEEEGLSSASARRASSRQSTQPIKLSYKGLGKQSGVGPQGNWQPFRWMRPTCSLKYWRSSRSRY
jgi:hypothetical protein